MAIPVTSGQMLIGHLYLQDKTPTPQAEFTPQLEVFLQRTINLVKSMGISMEFDKLLLFEHPVYAILTIEI